MKNQNSNLNSPKSINMDEISVRSEDANKFNTPVRGLPSQSMTFSSNKRKFSVSTSKQSVNAQIHNLYVNTLQADAAKESLLLQHNLEDTIERVSRTKTQIEKISQANKDLKMKIRRYQQMITEQHELNQTTEREDLFIDDGASFGPDEDMKMFLSLIHI